MPIKIITLEVVPGFSSSIKLFSWTAVAPPNAITVVIQDLLRLSNILTRFFSEYQVRSAEWCLLQVQCRTQMRVRVSKGIIETRTRIWVGYLGESVTDLACFTLDPPPCSISLLAFSSFLSDLFLTSLVLCAIFSAARITPSESVTSPVPSGAVTSDLASAHWPWFDQLFQFVPTWSSTLLNLPGNHLAPVLSVFQSLSSPAFHLYDLVSGCQ